MKIKKTESVSKNGNKHIVYVGHT